MASNENELPMPPAAEDQLDAGTAPEGTANDQPAQADAAPQADAGATDAADAAGDEAAIAADDNAPQPAAPQPAVADDVASSEGEAAPQNPTTTGEEATAPADASNAADPTATADASFTADDANSSSTDANALGNDPLAAGAVATEPSNADAAGTAGPSGEAATDSGDAVAAPLPTETETTSGTEKPTSVTSNGPTDDVAPQLEQAGTEELSQNLGDEGLPAPAAEGESESDADGEDESSEEASDLPLPEYPARSPEPTPVHPITGAPMPGNKDFDGGEACSEAEQYAQDLIGRIRSKVSHVADRIEHELRELLKLAKKQGE